ncbi:MAG TPA: DUF2851 family protein [Bacteroidia bacterium]|jgi:hypothetical protein|nr:DUF2851 family protein [Bacteroidia bacterium]
MTEEFLQYIWKHTLFDRSNLFTSDGKQVELIRTGLHNHDSGPDFFNARLKIDGTLWAGNVEIHIRSSAWGQHKHQLDEAYKNVILHVVWEDDEPVFRADKSPIPAIELKKIVPQDVFKKYSELRFSSKDIPCEKDIHKIDSISLHAWMDRLVAERLERKTNYISAKLVKTINDWEEVFYQMLLRNLGSPVNSEPFERLALQLPYKIIAKHRSNPLQVEALLFGQAGLLEGTFRDNYPLQLQKEYAYLKHKLDLTPLSKSEWKFMRIRPPHFPSIRIAQLAALFTTHGRLFRDIIEAEKPKDISKLFSVDPNPYWHNHYRFDKPSSKTISGIGASTIDILIINTVVPVLFIYGKNTFNDDACEKAFNLLHAIKAEKNSLLAKWKTLGIPAKDACDSQALIQLRKEYCDERKCVNCAIGHQLMKTK